MCAGNMAVTVHSYLRMYAVSGVVAHIFNRSTWEAETGGSLWGWGQPGLHSNFQRLGECGLVIVSLYLEYVRPWPQALALKKKEKQNQTNPRMSKGTTQWRKCLLHTLEVWLPACTFGGGSNKHLLIHTGEDP